MPEIKKGRYRHYKGNEYQVLDIVHSADNNLPAEQEMVIYQDVSNPSKTWVRSSAEFLEEAETPDGLKPRFEFLSEGAPEDLDCWENKYKRALADYHNLVKQTAKDKQEFVRYALDNFLQEILPVYDHLKMSLAGLSKEEAKSPWAEGVRHVLKQFKEVLSDHGVEGIKTVGEKFDHDLMEALQGSGEIVKQEVSAGYKLHGKVIRPAKVIVE